MTIMMYDYTFMYTYVLLFNVPIYEMSILTDDSINKTLWY